MYGKKAGGGVLLTLEVGETPDLRNWLLSFGSGAEVLEPDSLRRGVALELEQALGRYASNPSE